MGVGINRLRFQNPIGHGRGGRRHRLLWSASRAVSGWTGTPWLIGVPELFLLCCSGIRTKAQETGKDISSRIPPYPPLQNIAPASAFPLTFSERLSGVEFMPVAGKLPSGRKNAIHDHDGGQALRLQPRNSPGSRPPMALEKGIS